jgi:hypothetical protein
MGKKGTEIARHAADLILTDDRPGKITDAIEQGRKIYNNLKKAIRYIISIHIPIILTVMLPLLLGWKYANIFTPIHIIFLELIMGPTCSIFFEQEPAESNIMNIGPRKAGPGIFSSSELFVSIIQGIVMTIGLLVVYYYFMVQDFTVEYTRTMVFITILLCNVFLTFTNRSFEKTMIETMRYKNRFVPLVLGISIVFISSLLFVPPLQKLFYLTPIRPLHFIFGLGISILSAGWFEIYKLGPGRFRKFIVILFLCTLPGAAVSGQDHPPAPSRIGSRTDTVRLFYPRLVNTFYGIGHQERFWFSENEQSLLLRLALKDIIDSAANIGLDKNKYHYAELVNYTSKDLPAPDPSIATSMDSIFTDIAIAFFKDIYQGANISSLVSADGLSAKYSEADDHYILRRLSEARSAILLRQTANSLEPGVPAYLLLKEKLIKELKTPRPDTVRSLVTTLNLFRWIYHFRLNQFIVINIPSASLLYYESDTLKLKMKVVLGKPSTRTPRFAAYCDQIILYPYWNVPRKIAVSELLPLFKKSPGLIDAMNMQVVDNKGEILDPRKLVWSAFDKSNFPYRFRQSTGCDNALGVIKFNLTSPFDVYMHDTNLKSAFQSSFRYYSHGCIRLEKPIELGNFLLHGRLDPVFLKSCLKDQKPVTLKLDKPIPVFVVYGLVGADEMNNIIYYKDIYRLMRQTAR